MPPCMARYALGLEFGSAARLSKRPGSVLNCLWGHAVKRSLEINRKSMVFYSVLVSVPCPKALYHLESDNIFRITVVVADWLD